jgi:hydrogenase maturation protease
VIGVGNRWAGDDSAGLLVAEALRDRVPAGVAVTTHEGEPTALLDLWEGARVAVVVDAITGAGPPGAVHAFDATTSPLPASFAGPSTHAFSVAQAIELARRLGRLPARVVVVGVEGRRFEAGAAPTPEVEDAIPAGAARVLDVLRADYGA